MAKRRLRGAIALLSLCVVTPALGQTFESNPLALEPGAHAVGFRLLPSEDRSRLVTGGTGPRVHPRPVRTYLWYPAHWGAQDRRPPSFDGSDNPSARFSRDG
jgi:hypothetical protein